MQLVQKYHQAMVYFQISRLRNELGVVSIRICPLQISKQMFTHVGPIWTCYLLVIRWQSSLKLKQCIPKKYVFMLLLFTSNDSFWSAVESVQTTQVTCLSEYVIQGDNWTLAPNIYVNEKLRSDNNAQEKIKCAQENNVKITKLPLFVVKLTHLTKF